MEEVMNEVVAEEVVKKPAKKPAAKKTVEAEVETPVVAKTPRKYEPNDTIMCHSIFPGTFLFSGPKSKIVYPFEAPGDENPIEYQDLLAAMMSKKKSIMAPYIVVDDEDLLEAIHWKQVKKIYDDMYAAKDLDKLLDMPFQTFKKNFEKLPIGAKKRVMMTISSRVRSGEFSEMNKIRLVDEACSSNIAVLLSR
jgi:hypothetical protein